MSTTHPGVKGEPTRNLPRAHEWEMVSSFALSLPEDRLYRNDCMLEPLAQALEPLGLSDCLVCEISAEVEAAGEDLRGNCPNGHLDSLNVRVYVSSRGLRIGMQGQAAWKYFVIKEMASSESDNLNPQDDPYCYIDLHVYPEI